MAETSESNPDDDIFYDDWVSCLSAHYQYTLVQDDLENAKSLRRVLIEAGMNDAYVDSLNLPESIPADAMPVEAESEAAAPESAETGEPLPEPIPEMIAAPLELIPIVAPTPQIAPTPEVAPIMPIAATFDTLAEKPIERPAVVAAPPVELTPDYPSGGKGKRPKKPAPPQPSLF